MGIHIQDDLALLRFYTDSERKRRESEPSFAAIEIERVNEQFGGVCILEKCVPSVRHGCDEKSSYLLRSMGHV
jgi:hypothetical protein